MSASKMEPTAENALALVDMLLNSLADTYVPGERERQHLDKGLVEMIAAYKLRDFEPGEEAVWNCHGITIGGSYEGEWEVRLRRTDSPLNEPESPSRTNSDFKTVLKTASEPEEKPQ